MECTLERTHNVFESRNRTTVEFNQDDMSSMTRNRVSLCLCHDMVGGYMYYRVVVGIAMVVYQIGVVWILLVDIDRPPGNV